MISWPRTRMCALGFPEIENGQRIMRATSPADSLASDMGLQLPKFKVGDMVKPGTNWERDFPYYLKKYARHLIQRMRRMKSICPGRTPQGRIPDYNKAQIRDCLTVFREATEFQVAGIFVRHGHNVDYTKSNVCYLHDIEGCSSGPTYEIQLLIRFERDGKKLGLIVGYGVGESSLRMSNENDSETTSD